MAFREGQLSRIAIKGYKSIYECSIDLKAINVLIGSNGAGKSNFVSVFTLLQNILRQNLAVTSQQSGVSSLFYNGLKTTDEISMEFFFGDDAYGFVLIPTDDGRLIFQKEYFKYYGPNYNNESIIASGHSESQWRNGVKNQLDDFVKPILEKESWRVYHFHDTGRTAKVKQEHNVVNNVVFQQDASNLAAFLLRLREHYPMQYKEIVATVRTIAPFFDDFVLTPNENNHDLIVLKWQKKYCDDIFTASQLSDGTLRFICMSTLLLQPEELMPSTIIVDEPELGLHPFAITVLAELVKSVSQKKQLILSTQSVELLNWFDPDDVIVVDNSNKGSAFRRLNSEKLSAWLEKDYSLGDLWNKNLFGGRLTI
ncbi:MAG: AAA family ATPase [Clostridia bacterium]|nr:AAA family ATPase [Clostridia bacterium]